MLSVVELRLRDSIWYCCWATVKLRVVVPPEKVAQIPLPLQGPRVNLVASQVSGKPEAVTVYAHMDVVPIEPGTELAAWVRA